MHAPLATAAPMLTVRSTLATALRFGLGGRVGALGPRPSAPLELHEFESCPFCRKVREVLVWLDLDAEIRPCPPGGHRHRDLHGGPYPLLIDAGEAVRGSSPIVRRLVERHGDGRVPWPLRLGPLTTATTALASALLPRVRALPARPLPAPDLPARPLPAPDLPPPNPNQPPLELFADETSAAARRVRTELCARELPYRWRTAGRGSAKLAELRARTGSADLPVLLDNGHVLRGAGPIVDHLRRTHG